MKDNILAIILSVVIIFLVGAIGFGLVANQAVNVSVTSNPQNNADGGSPQVSSPQDSGQTIGMAQKPDLIITKLVDYDDITTGGVQIFATSTGAFYLDNLIMETASSTIASGTIFQVYSLGETYGNSETVFSTHVSSFAKNTTMDLNTAITASVGYASSTQRVVIDDQSALYAKCTAASCQPSTDRSSETAANGVTYGYVKFTAILKRVDSGSSIYE